MPTDNFPLHPVGARGRMHISSLLRRLWPDTAVHEFHPGAIEIVRTPAPPLGRVISWCIMVVTLAAFLWAWFGQVDVVVVARGRVVPTGNSKEVQAPEVAQVAAIHVTEGQLVSAGQVLLDLNPTEAEADRQRLKADLLDAKLNEARLSALSAAPDDPEAALHAFIEPDGAGEAATLHRQMLVGAVEENRARWSAMEAEAAERAAEAQAAKAELDRYAFTTPLLREQVEARRGLAAKGNSPRLELLTLERQLIDAEMDGAVQRGRLAQAEAASLRLSHATAQARAQLARQTATELAETRRRISALTQDLVKAEHRSDRLRLKSPVAGHVQQLAVHSGGAVVTPGQALLVVVPQGDRLEVEARVENRDVGEVQFGQQVAVKVDAYDFTRYGLANGTVRTLTRDAVPPADADPASQSSPQGEPVYLARIELDTAPSAGPGSGGLELVPGMGVSVEFKVGRRRILDYLLSPVVEHVHESLRER